MNQRDKRALLAGGGIVIAGLLLGRVLPAGIRWWAGAQVTLADRSALLVREQRDLGTVPQLEDSAKVVQASFVALAPEVLSGGTDAEALSDLEGRMTLIAGRHNAKVIRLDAAPDSAVIARLREVRVSMEVESDWAGIVAFLKGVDDDPAAIEVRSLDVSAADPTSSSARPEVLHADLEVTGWYLHPPRPEDLQQASAMAAARRP